MHERYSRDRPGRGRWHQRRACSRRSPRVADSINRPTSAIAISKNARQKGLQAAGIGMLLSLIDVVAILWALTTLFEPKVQS